MEAIMLPKIAVSKRQPGGVGVVWRNAAIFAVSIGMLRVCPETSGGIAKFSEHEADRGEAQECERFAIKVLPILGESAAAVEPREGALDDPAFGQYDKSLGLI